MVRVSVRQNRPEPIGRNAQPHDPRPGRTYPHPDNPGLFEAADGFYDWADRRLFLADGSPDPMTPGAYRYQTRPDLCDLAAPASDPASPHYEPPHLRHKPGDTWIIGGKPRDPDDPGPYGSPRWRPDSRTGRHRRDELPDPIPPWEAREEPEEVVEPEVVEPEAGGPEADGAVPPWRPRRRTPTPAPGPEPQPEPKPESRPGAPSATSRFPVTPDRPASQPRRRTRFWTEPDDQAGAQETAESQARAQKAESAVAQEEPYRFSKMREDAWDRFVIKSAELAAAHWADRRALGAQHRWLAALLLRAFRWVSAIVTGSRSDRALDLGALPQRQPSGVVPQRSAGASPPPPVSDPQRQPFRQSHAQFRPGLQLGQAIRGVQAARATRAAGTRGAEYFPGRPRQERPSALPYMARWERAFDGQRGFGEAVVL